MFKDIVIGYVKRYLEVQVQDRSFSVPDVALSDLSPPVFSPRKWVGPSPIREIRYLDLTCDPDGFSRRFSQLMDSIDAGLRSTLTITPDEHDPNVIVTQRDLASLESFSVRMFGSDTLNCQIHLEAVKLRSFRLEDVMKVVTPNVFNDSPAVSKTQLEWRMFEDDLNALRCLEGSLVAQLDRMHTPAGMGEGYFEVLREHFTHLVTRTNASRGFVAPSGAFYQQSGRSVKKVVFLDQSLGPTPVYFHKKVANQFLHMIWAPMDQVTVMLTKLMTHIYASIRIMNSSHFGPKAEATAWDLKKMEVFYHISSEWGRDKELREKYMTPKFVSNGDAIEVKRVYRWCYNFWAVVTTLRACEEFLLQDTRVNGLLSKKSVLERASVKELFCEFLDDINSLIYSCVRAKSTRFMMPAHLLGNHCLVWFRGDGATDVYPRELAKLCNRGGVKVPPYHDRDNIPKSHFHVSMVCDGLSRAFHIINIPVMDYLHYEGLSYSRAYSLLDERKFRSLREEVQLILLTKFRLCLLLEGVEFYLSFEEILSWKSLYLDEIEDNFQHLVICRSLDSNLGDIPEHDQSGPTTITFYKCGTATLCQRFRIPVDGLRSSPLRDFQSASDVIESEPLI
jgi:hypothetical protein